MVGVRGEGGLGMRSEGKGEDLRIFPSSTEKP